MLALFLSACLWCLSASGVKQNGVEERQGVRYRLDSGFESFHATTRQAVDAAGQPAHRIRGDRFELRRRVAIERKETPGRHASLCLRRVQPPDPQEREPELNDPSVTRYGWDGERMCAEVKDGLTRTTIYEPGSHVPAVADRPGRAKPLTRPEPGPAPGVQRLFAPPRPKPPARIAHYHTDHLGTPLMLTGPEGKVLWWGEPRRLVRSPRRKGRNRSTHPLPGPAARRGKRAPLQLALVLRSEPRAICDSDPIGLDGD